MVGQQADASPIVSIQFSGRHGEFVSIWLLNILLNICTLGIYNSWGRTRIRRYLTSRFSIAGDSCEYTGVATELLRGFLYSLPGIALLAYLASEIIDGTERLLLIVPAFLLFLYVYQVAIYAAYRYRLSRTRWRGICGRLSGSAWGLRLAGRIDGHRQPRDPRSAVAAGRPHRPHLFDEQRLDRQHQGNVLGLGQGSDRHSPSELVTFCAYNRNFAVLVRGRGSEVSVQ